MILQAGADFPKYRGIQSQCDGNATTRVLGEQKPKTLQGVFVKQKCQVGEVKIHFLENDSGYSGVFWFLMFFFP